MCAKERRSRDQKRRAKLAQRAKKQEPAGPLPYSGRKYQTERWVPHVYQTELAIYEAIVLSRRQLTNPQVREALVQLIGHLREGKPPLLAEDAPAIAFSVGNEVEFLVWNIRSHWRSLFEEQGPVSTEDLVGILRTLLHSIEAQAWARGPSRGYVSFLDEFMRQGYP